MIARRSILIHGFGITMRRLPALLWTYVFNLGITLLTLIVGGIVIGPLLALQNAWAAFVDDHTVGRRAFLLRISGLVVIFLIASVIRLYFDLVEVYTVQISRQLRLTLFAKTE